MTEAAIARHFAKRGEVVRMIGSYENPRSPSDNSFNWLIDLLELDEVDFRVDASKVVRYIWNGVNCICAPQSQVEAIVDSFVGQASSVWTTQEGSAELGKKVRSDRLSTYIHSISATGIESLASNPRFVFVPSHFVADVVSRLGRPDAHLLRPPFELPNAPVVVPQEPRVLFVNPVKDKGVEVALSIALALPKLSFEFVEGWTLLPSTSSTVRGHGVSDEIRDEACRLYESGLSVQKVADRLKLTQSTTLRTLTRADVTMRKRKNTPRL